MCSSDEISLSRIGKLWSDTGSIRLKPIFAFFLHQKQSHRRFHYWLPSTLNTFTNSYSKRRNFVQTTECSKWNIEVIEASKKHLLLDRAVVTNVNRWKKLVEKAGRIDEYMPIDEARSGTSSLPYGNGYASRKFTSFLASVPSFSPRVHPPLSAARTLNRFQPSSEHCASLLRAKLYNGLLGYCVGRKNKTEKEGEEGRRGGKMEYVRAFRVTRENRNIKGERNVYWSWDG